MLIADDHAAIHARLRAIRSEEGHATGMSEPERTPDLHARRLAICPEVLGIIANPDGHLSIGRVPVRLRQPMDRPR